MDPEIGLPRKCASVSFVTSSIFAQSSPADLKSQGEGQRESQWEAS